MAHYRDYYDKNFIAAADLEPDQSYVLKIKSAGGEEVQDQNGKNTKLVITFQNHDKKYIPGYKMAEKIGEITGHKEVKDWAGSTIELYLANEKHFGDFMDVVRVRRPIDRQVVEQIEKAKTLDELEKIYKALKPHEKTDKAILAVMLTTKKTLK